MSLGGSYVRRNANLAVPTPIYADANDSPIDLRKKVAIRRQRRFEYGYSDDDDDEGDSSPPVLPRHSLPEADGNIWYSRKNAFHNVTSANPYFLSLRNIHPGLSEQYGIQYALFNSPEGTHVVPVPYSPFHHRSIVSEYKHRLTNDHRNLPFIPSHEEASFPQRLDNHHHHLETKRILKNNLLNRERKVESPPKVIADQKSNSPSPTEHYKKRHLKQSYWSKQENETHSHGSHHNVQQVSQRMEGVKESSEKSIKEVNFSRNSWMRASRTMRTRMRSHSCSDIRDGKVRDFRRKHRIHEGYGSDSEISLSVGKPQPGLPAVNGTRTSPDATKTYHAPTETEDGSNDSTTKVRKNHTLLNLLGGGVQTARNSPPNRKKGIDMLLQQLQQSPANHNSRRDDGYPWSVYEYYNHLVERSSRITSSNYIPRTFVDHSPLMEEDSANMQRKRPSRALTGKHVKHGTGASPATLITLRQKIQERQKAKELLLLHGQPEAFGKVSSSRSVLSKKLKLANFKRVKQDPPQTLYRSSEL